MQAKAESLEDIVVADHLHVLRHLQSTLGKALAESQGHHIVAAEHCRGTAVDNSIGSMISAVETVVTRNAQCGIETLPRLFDGIHETTFAVKRTRFRDIARHDADMTVPAFQQVPCGETAAHIVVESDGIAPAVLYEAVDEHHRTGHLLHIGSQLIFGGAGLARGNQHHAIDTSGGKSDHQIMFGGTRIVGIGHNQRIALCGALIFHAFRQCGEKQVFDVGHNQRHEFRLFGHQAARALVRHVMQFFGRLGDKLALLLRHACRTSVKHQRHGGHRHSRRPRHVFQRCTPCHTAPLEHRSF